MNKDTMIQAKEAHKRAAVALHRAQTVSSNTTAVNLLTDSMAEIVACMDRVLTLLGEATRG